MSDGNRTDEESYLIRRVSVVGGWWGTVAWVVSCRPTAEDMHTLWNVSQDTEQYIVAVDEKKKMQQGIKMLSNNILYINVTTNHLCHIHNNKIISLK